MRKLVAAINITIDGFCDHTAVVADDEIHQHYTDLLQSAGTIIYGRVTFELMKYWQEILKSPTGNKSTDEFSVAIDNIEKIVFSHTLKQPGWETARMAKSDLKEEVSALKQQEGKDILVGSPGLIASLTELGLIDEYQLCIHPVIVGSGLPLFKNIIGRTVLKFLKTKTFNCGAVIIYYSR